MNVMLNMYGDRPSWQKGPQFKDRMANGEEIRENFIDPGWAIEPKDTGVQIYDANATPCQFIKSMSVRDYPDEMAYGGMINLIGQWLSGAVVLNEHYILTLNIVYPDEAKAKKRFSMKRGIVNNQAKGEILQWLEKLRYQRNDYATVAREMDQEGSKIIEYSIQMSAFCKNEEDAEDFYQKVSGFYEKSNFKLVADSYFTLPFVLAVLPFGLDDTFKRMSHRFSYATTKALRFITPHIGGWKGNTSRPVMVMGDRFGQAVSLDFFESPTNFNIYCAATSGSGKSFLISTLVNAILGSGVEHNSAHNTAGSPRYYDGGQVFMIDVGESYKKLAAMYNNSQFLEFGKDAKYSLNPFPSITDMKDVDQMPMILSLLKTMASPEGKISDDQNAQLMKIVMNIWEEKGHESTITDISSACKNSNFEFMKSIGRQLEPFSEGGPYADYLNNKYPPVSFDTRLVVCELEQIKSNKHLQITVLMSLVMGIQRKMYISSKDDPRRRMFILDEAWEFLKDEKTNPMMKFFGEFIEAGWRRFRKYGASGCLATQSVNDASVSQVGQAVLANSAWKLLLGQQNTEVEALRKNNTIGGAGVIRQLETVHTKPPNPRITDEAYSECLVISNDISHICRLYTPRDIQLINTTKKEEKDMIKSYMDKGMAIGEAIKQIVEKEEKEKAY
jgi:conjugal transfer ATP-binding protein TraC